MVGMNGSPSGLVHRRFVLAVACLAVALASPFSVVPVDSAEASPPPQPADGPGGSDYAFAAVTRTRVGEVPSGAWIFSPGEIPDVERSRMPVVLFLHGFGATDPATYRGWITHLVRRGNTVIYPDYQPEGFLVLDQSAFVANMLAGLEQGLDVAGLEPDAIHVVGHSLGAVMGSAYLALGSEAGFAPVASLTLVTPGGCGTCGTTSGFGVPLPGRFEPPEGLLVNIVTGSDDTIVGNGDALAIWTRLAEVPEGRKRLVKMQSDRYGSPGLIADHLFPQSDGFGGEVDALDWYGVWRPLDSLIACAETGRLCEVALGKDEMAMDMGNWSDGTPVMLPVIGGLGGS